MGRVTFSNNICWLSNLLLFLFGQKKIDKRGRKLIDFDAERHGVQQMQNNPNRNEVRLSAYNKLSYAYCTNYKLVLFPECPCSEATALLVSAIAPGFFGGQPSSFLIQLRRLSCLPKTGFDQRDFRPDFAYQERLTLFICPKIRYLTKSWTNFFLIKSFLNTITSFYTFKYKCHMYVLVNSF